MYQINLFLGGKTPIQILANCDAICKDASIQYDLEAYAIANAARRIALERVIMEIGDVLSVNDSLFLSWSAEIQRNPERLSTWPSWPSRGR